MSGHSPSGRGAAEEAARALQGSWQPVEAELGGQRLPEQAMKGFSLTIQDGEYVVRTGEQLDKGTIRVDTKPTPATMDVHGAQGPNEGKTFPAIYELKGDALRICYDLAGKVRPERFETAAGTQQFLVTYRRVKE